MTKHAQEAGEWEGRVRVGTVDDLPFDRATAAADGRVALVRVGDSVIAFENRCLHADQPMADGVISDGVLMCPHHFWRYRLPSGLLTSSGTTTADQALAALPVEIIDGEIVVDIPPAEPERSTRELLLDHARNWKRDDPR